MRGEDVPGVDPLIGLFVQGIAAAILIVTSIFWVIAAVAMFLWFGFKNGFGKTTQSVWESTAPTSKNKTI
jgi:cytoskeletal protein RodZ